MTAVETYIVRDSLSEQAGALLDELDTLISDLDAALAEQHAARLVIADAELEMALIEASATLSTNGSNTETRKASVLLALKADPAHQTHAQAVRSARAGLFTAERTATITKERLRLVRAALALLTNGTTAA